jgi:hypothetical protein
MAEGVVSKVLIVGVRSADFHLNNSRRVDKEVCE